MTLASALALAAPGLLEHKLYQRTLNIPLQANILYAVPPIVLLLGNHPQPTDEHVASLRLIMTGAGPISASDAERILSRFKSNYVINQGR